MIMDGALPNYFTINGKAYPSTETVHMKVGQRILLRFIGSNNNFEHPMHVHGGPFRIVETDGNLVPPSAQVEKDTVEVGPGERYGVIWTAREPGRWLLHCHIPHHTINDNVEERCRWTHDDFERFAVVHGGRILNLMRLCALEDGLPHQRGALSPARVTATSRRTAALERRLLAAVRA